MIPIDTYRDTFQSLLAQGNTYAEALDQFDVKLWNAAVVEELPLLRINPRTFTLETEDGRIPLLTLSSMAGREQSDSKDMEQAIALWCAGWTSEVPDCLKTNSKHFWLQCPVMSWYWRRPPRRKGKPGRKYLSTNQAFNAMRKAQ